MSDEATIATLAATLVGVQKSQDATTAASTHAFQRIMEKLDVLPKMQTDLAVGNERMSALAEKMSSHMKVDEDEFKAQKSLIEGQDARIQTLEKQGWIQKGMAIAIGGAAGFATSFLHKP